MHSANQRVPSLTLPQHVEGQGSAMTLAQSFSVFSISTSHRLMVVVALALAGLKVLLTTKAIVVARTLAGVHEGFAKVAGVVAIVQQGQHLVACDGEQITLSSVAAAEHRLGCVVALAIETSADNSVDTLSVGEQVLAQPLGGRSRCDL